MARIDLNVHLSTSDLDEAADILQRLKGLKSEPLQAPNLSFTSDVEGYVADKLVGGLVDDAPQTRKGRGPNKPKDTAPAASAAAEPEKPEASSASDVQSDSAPDVGVEKVRELLNKFASAEGKSLLQAQNLIAENFKSTSDTPVKRISDLQAKDYGRAVSLLSAELGL
jgi:hypothetical protein